jgi:ribonuclease HI
MKQVQVYADGACSGNPGPGGWGAILRFGGHERELAGFDPATTNNRMELLGVIEALRTLKEPCEVAVFSDSRYVVDGAMKWLSGWKRNGFKNAAKKDVANPDLWRALDEQMARHKVSFTWVLGHSGHVENERCDALARAQIKRA